MAAEMRAVFSPENYRAGGGAAGGGRIATVGLVGLHGQSFTSSSRACGDADAVLAGRGNALLTGGGPAGRYLNVKFCDEV